MAGRQTRQWRSQRPCKKQKKGANVQSFGRFSSVPGSPGFPAFLNSRSGTKRVGSVESDSIQINDADFLIAGEGGGTVFLSSDKHTLFDSDASSEFEDVQSLLSKTAPISQKPQKQKGQATMAGFSNITVTILGALNKKGAEGDWNDMLLDEEEHIAVPKPSSSTMQEPRKRLSSGQQEDIEDERQSISTKRRRLSANREKGGYKGIDEEQKRKKMEKEAERKKKKLDAEAEKERKYREKEAKALEKQKEQELTAVNKLKHSKQESMPEMIVDISRPFSETAAGLQLIRFLEPEGCQIEKDWEAPLPNAVKWRRKVNAEWNEESGYFVPIPEVIRDEKHILVVLRAEEFVEIVTQQRLDGHVSKLRNILINGCPEVKSIYMIEGLAGLLRKSRNAKSRNFQGAVRNAIGTCDVPAPVNSRGRGKGRALETIDEKAVEDALLRLQLLHGCLIHHSANTTETSQWICIFTADISTIPYKLSRMNFSTSFCTDVGQVKTGADAPDTYLKMLQEISRVTVGVATGIMNEYPTVRSLVEGLRRHGEGILADLDIMAGNNPTGRKIGQAVSRRIYRIFMGEDPDCTDL